MGRATRSGSGRRKARKIEKPKATKIPRDEETLLLYLDSVNKKLKGADYDAATSSRVIRAALTLQLDWVLERKRRGKEKSKELAAPGIRDTITRLFGLSNSSYQSIVSRFLQTQSIYQTGRDEGGRTGNSNAKEMRIAGTQRTINLVRDFVRGMRSKRERVTGEEVTHHLIAESLLDVEKEDEETFDRKALDSARRAVRRFLIQHGYKRGKKKGAIVASPKNEFERDFYLSTLLQNRLKPPQERLREVYLDESYCHHHYLWKPSETIYDPNDDQDIKFGKDPAKGERYCFLCAIQGPSPMAEERSQLQGVAGGVVPLSLWLFSPTRRDHHKGDYHKVFNSLNFLQWWEEQLLPGLNEPSLIMMDNAKYHKTFGPHVPKVYQLKKEQVREYLTSKSIAFTEEDTAPLLKAKANAYIRENEQMECVRLAEMQGHQVLFTPAYHSDLQPIELVWARVKGNTGRQYNSETKLTDVRDRLIEEFDRLDTDEGIKYINKVIEKTFRLSKKLWDELHAEEEQEEAVEAQQEDDPEKEDDPEEADLDDDEASDSSVFLLSNEPIIEGWNGDSVFV
jgi:transposase